MIEQAVAAAMGALLKGPLDHHLDIEGADGEFSLYTSSGSLVSLFDWRGSREFRGEKEMSEAAQGLRSSLAAWFAAPGHAIQILFCRDPAAAEDEAASAVAPAAAQASALSLELKDIFEDRRARLAQGGVCERLLLVAYTHPAAGARREGTVNGRTPLPERLMLPLRDAQLPVRASERTRLLHSALIDALPADFRRAGQEIHPLPANEAARMIAWSLSPAEGDVGFTPRLATGRSPAVPGRPCRAARAPGTRAAPDRRRLFSRRPRAAVVAASALPTLRSRDRSSGSATALPTRSMSPCCLRHWCHSASCSIKWPTPTARSGGGSAS